LTGDPALESLHAEVMAYPNIVQVAPLLGTPLADDPPLLVPLRLASPAGELSLFTTLTTFGTPLDVTVDELAVELFFPADDRTDQILRTSAAGPEPASTVRSFHPAGA
jgi:hypothetical protein